MTKQVVDWETMNYFLQKLKEEEKKWKEQHPFGHKIITASSVEYFINRVFAFHSFNVEDSDSR